VRVMVKGCKDGRAIDFKTEIVPLLSKLGCNAGGCHGKASGQNGFKLSLFGFDADFDHAALVKEAPRPAHLCRRSGSKPACCSRADRPDGARRRQEGHGGQRGLSALAALDSGGRAPRRPAMLLIVVKLHVTPTDRVLPQGAEQQLAVVAEYSDGSRRDVTRQSEFFGNLDTVAMIDSTGLVTAGQQSGEAALMARHRGHVAVLSRHRPAWSAVDRTARLEGEQTTSTISPPPSGRNSAWLRRVSAMTPRSLRRVTVDLCGRLPTAEEARTFLADTQNDKRSRLIDRLLDSPDYPAFFALRWGNDSAQLEPRWFPSGRLIAFHTTGSRI